MQYSDIIPTHNKLRNPDSFRFFHSNYKAILDAAKPPLLLRMEDGKYYLNDGHHRMTAAFAMKLPIEAIEFRIMEMTYAKMTEINWEDGWLTPYDPRTHVRQHNFMWFKKFVMEFYIDKRSEFNVLLNINGVAERLYSEIRTANSLGDLIP
jgi:hypothetical protein